jgi:tetratricopeptide (TPR) repeat protein
VDDSPGRESGTPVTEIGTLLRKVAAAPALTPRLREGARIGEAFEIVRVLGAGGMGVVYEAMDLALDRRVAIKLHRRPDAATQTMLREAQTMARVRHPNVVAVHAVGTHEGALFIAMEYVAGGTLRSWLAARPSSAAILDAFDGAAQGLAAAHAAGLVHRDFKLDNVLMDEGDRPRVADFGLARTEAEHVRSDSTLGDDGSSPATLTRAFACTPAYAAPEQLRGEPADARSDQFSFFVALHEALYGALPFEIQPLVTLVQRIEEGRFADLDPRRRRQVPTAVRTVILRGLASDRSARFPDMNAAAIALRRARARPRRLAIAVLGTVGLGVAAFAVLSGPRARSCDAATEIAQVWNPERRAALETTMVVGDDTRAVQRFAATASAIDAYASQWSLQWESECGTPEVAACLASSRMRLHTLLQLFERTQSSSLVFATDAVARLPAPESCSAAALPDGVARSDVQIELESRLLDARLRYLADPDIDDTGELEAIADEAERGGHSKIAAHALAVAAKRLSDHDRNVDGQSLLRRAAPLAVESGDRQTMAMVWSLLAKVLAENGQGDEAAEKIDLARGSASGVSDVEVSALVEYNSGIVFGSVGRSAEAVTALQRAVELTTEAYGPDNREVAICREALGYQLRDQGRLDESREQLEQALLVNRTIMGEDHPTTARMLQGIGMTCMHLGDLACADRALSDARDVYTRALGEVAPPTLRATTTLAELRRQQGRLDEALELFQRVHELGKTREPFADVRATAALNVAVALATRGDFAGALPFAEDGRQTLVRELGPERHDLVHIDTTLGIILRELGRLDESVASLRRAVALAERVLDPRDRQRVNAKIELGHTLMAMDERDAAASAFEEALGALADPPGPPPLVAEAEFGLARALGPSSSRAREAAARALAVYEKLGPGHAATVEAIQRWRAGSPG